MEQNRAEWYGDGFFETIYCENGEAPLLPFHHRRMIKSAEILGIELSDYFQLSNLQAEISRMFPQSSMRLRLDVYRQHGNGYLPLNHNASWKWSSHLMVAPPEGSSGLFTLLQVKNLNDLRALVLQLPKRKTGISSYVKFADPTRLSEVKSTSSLLYVMASKELKDNFLDEIILLNQHGRICETQHANIFILIEGVIYTPPLSEGPVDGVGRAWLKTKFPEYFKEEILPPEMLSDSEVLVFSINAIRGLTRLSLPTK